MAQKASCYELVSRAISEASKLLVYTRLREGQELEIREFLKGKDVFVSLPTGSGKSLCYWILPYIFDFIRGRCDSMVLVVSPLIAIMQDQVDIFAYKRCKSCVCWKCSCRDKGWKFSSFIFQSRMLTDRIRLARCATL